jgi:hypothetical protein
MMTTLETWLLRACDALGLKADLSFTVRMGSSADIRCVARIQNLGAENGMLVVHCYEDVRPYVDQLAKAGYGYSVLDEPREDEVFDLDSFQEMFRDWGWSGSEKDRPPSLR